VVCGVEITNSGNVGLNDTTVTDQTVLCPTVPQLAPGQVHQCNMSRVVPQTEFDAWDANGTRVALAVDITALPTGVVAVNQISNLTNGSTVLVSRPSFNATDVTVAPVSVLNAGVSLLLDSLFCHAQGVRLIADGTTRSCGVACGSYGLKLPWFLNIPGFGLWSVCW
jgi:hypothetical protein